MDTPWAIGLSRKTYKFQTNLFFRVSGFDSILSLIAPLKVHAAAARRVCTQNIEAELASLCCSLLTCGACQTLCSDLRRPPGGAPCRAHERARVPDRGRQCAAAALRLHHRRGEPLECTCCHAKQLSARCMHWAHRHLARHLRMHLNSCLRAVYVLLDPFDMYMWWHSGTW